MHARLRYSNYWLSRFCFVSMVAIVLTGTTQSLGGQVLSTTTSPEKSKAIDLWSAPYSELTDFTVHDDALLLLSQYLAAAGAPWTSLRISGQIAMGASGKVPASLLMQGDQQAILRIQQETGLVGIQVEGMLRRALYGEGTSSATPTPAGGLGLFPLQVLQAQSIAQNAVALKLDGQYTLDGALCDKLTVRVALIKSASIEASRASSVQADYYLMPRRTSSSDQ